MKKFMNWLVNHGVGVAFTFILMASMAVASIVMLVVIGIVLLYNKIH